MASPRLSRGAAKIIDQKIDNLFDHIKAHALGHHSPGRRLFIEFKRPLSIPGMFEEAVTQEGGKVDLELVERLVGITSDLLDQHKATAKAAVKKRIQDFLQEVQDGQRERSEFRSQLEQELGDIWKRVTHSVDKVLSTEVQHAQTIGIKEGIDQINTMAGVKDPVVCFIPVKDDSLCDECRRLHLLEDGVTPRCWLTSEVKAGYHKKGDPQPSWSLLHPHCRCTLVTLLPGYGFNKAGQVQYRAAGWNELEHQRR
jgi:hypothetical protein